MKPWYVIHWKKCYWAWVQRIDGVWCNPDGKPVPVDIMAQAKFVERPYAYE